MAPLSNNYLHKMSFTIAVISLLGQRSTDDSPNVPGARPHPSVHPSIHMCCTWTVNYSLGLKPELLIKSEMIWGSVAEYNVYKTGLYPQSPRWRFLMLLIVDQGRFSGNKKEHVNCSRWESRHLFFCFVFFVSFFQHDKCNTMISF